MSWYDSRPHFDSLTITQEHPFDTALIDSRPWKAADHCLTRVLIKSPIILGGELLNDEVVFIARRRNMSIKDGHFTKAKLDAGQAMRAMRAKFDLAWSTLEVMDISLWDIIWRYLLKS
jgi:hypothetical protein